MPGVKEWSPFEVIVTNVENPGNFHVRFVLREQEFNEYSERLKLGLVTNSIIFCSQSMISVKKVSFTNLQTQVSLVFDSPLWVPRSKQNTPRQCHCISVVLEATPEAKSRVRARK